MDAFLGHRRFFAYRQTRLNRKFVGIILITFIVFMISKTARIIVPTSEFDFMTGHWQTKIARTVVSSLAAQDLPRNGSVLCWVLTSPKYFQSRVLAINETWLPRCPHGQFFTTVPIQDESIPSTTAFSGLDDAYETLFYKTLEGFKYAYTHISEDFDWYLKADDDTYIIIEHLQEYLSKLDPSKPYYIGYPFKFQLAKGYNSGGAGYVLSNAAVKLFLEKAYDNRTLCPYDESEDLGLGRCLANIGIYPADTRNENDQHRFSPYSMKRIFETTEDDPEYTMWPEKRKFDAFAPEIISFHHQTPAELRMIEILLYRTNDPRLSKFHNK